MKCLGCCTSFKEGQKLIMEGLCVEYKNYSIPIKEDKPIRTLLKTIIAFLNSKGGTIYIGVQDLKGEVKGVELYQKQKSQFELFLKNILTSITPKVSMDTESLIQLQFVPVISKNTFESKYIIKIIIHQGDPSTVYCFVRRISLQDQKQQQQHQILCAYSRHNMGGVEECKGLNLIKQIRNKAINPAALSQIFHAGCNPDPLHIGQSIHIIQIVRVQQHQSKNIQQFFQEQLSLLKVQFSSCYKLEMQILLIKFQKVQQFQKVKTIVKQNLSVLSSAIDKYNFNLTEEYKSQLIIQKINKANSNKKQKSKKKQVEEKMKPNRQQLKQQKGIQNIYKNNKQLFQIQVLVDQISPKKTDKKTYSRQNQQNNVKKHKNHESFIKKYGVTLTNIDPLKIDDLVKYLNSIEPKKCKNIVKYNYSLQIFLQNQEQKEQFIINLFSLIQNFKVYGFNQKNVVFGSNQGILKITNFNYFLTEQLFTYLNSILSQDLSQIQCESKKRHSQICCLFSNKGRACFWFDKIIQNKKIKQHFSIPGSEKGIKPKIKITLQLQRYVIQNDI